MVEEKIDIDPERQREIEALEAKVGTTNHYEFLGVPSGATLEEVRNAFHALSKKFHPDRYFGKNLGTFKGRLDKVFRRLIEANQTLSDPEKLKAYLESNPFVRAAVKAANPSTAATGTAAKTSDEVARESERRARLSRHPYLAKASKITELVSRAKSHVGRGEYSHAFTQLNLASQIDPANVEVKTMLVDVRKKNEELRSTEDLKRGKDALERGDDEIAIAAFRSAATSNPKNVEAAVMAATLIDKRHNDPREASTFAQKAVDAMPKDAEYRVLLGRLLEAAGMKAMAKKHFEEAVRLDPDHPDVKKHAKRRWPF